MHHFLPAGSYANTQFIQPWCDKIAKESANRLKCQIYPSMQLGGTPPQLFDQVKDGVVDVAWTLTGYTAGRFPMTEVFELPFMMQNPEATSKAPVGLHPTARRGRIQGGAPDRLPRARRRRLPHAREAHPHHGRPQRDEAARAHTTDHAHAVRAGCHARGHAGASGQRSAEQGA